MLRSIEKAFNIFAVNHPVKRYLSTTAGVSTGIGVGILALPLDGGATFGSMIFLLMGTGAALTGMGEESSHYDHSGEHPVYHEGQEYFLTRAQKTKYFEIQSKIEQNKSAFEKSNSVGRKKSLVKKSQKLYRFQCDIIENADKKKTAKTAKEQAHKKALSEVKFDLKGSSGKKASPN